MSNYLKERGLTINVDEALTQYNFVMVNEYKDHWFWGLDLIGSYMGEDIALDILKYYKGVRCITSIVYFVLLIVCRILY